jgi:glycoprotein-N-acetylgalactosamine 3-beta-galactosyltransferase
LSDAITVIKNTWSKKCDKIIFTTTHSDPANDVVEVPGISSSSDANADHWQFLHPTILYTSQHYADEYDWFLKTDDDTYVVVDNLRQYLGTLPSPETMP